MVTLGKTYALVTTSDNGVTSVKTAFELGALQRTMVSETIQLKNTYPQGIVEVSKDNLSATFKYLDEKLQFNIITCENVAVQQGDENYSQVSKMRHWSEQEQEKNFIILDSNGDPVRFDDGTLTIYGDQECDGDITKFDTRISVKEFLRLIDTYPWLY